MEDISPEGSENFATEGQRVIHPHNLPLTCRRVIITEAALLLLQGRNGKNMGEERNLILAVGKQHYVRILNISSSGMAFLVSIF